MSTAAKAQADRISGQVSLFNAMSEAQRPPDFRFPTVDPWPLTHMLRYEKAVLGLYLTGHPMSAYGQDVKRFATASLSKAAYVFRRATLVNIILHVSGSVGGQTHQARGARAVAPDA